MVLGLTERPRGLSGIPEMKVYSSEMMAVDAVSLFAPAKINLFLDVTGRREDGMHEIETVFWPLDSPRDRVAVAPTPGCELRIGMVPPLAPADERNTCHRAALLFAQAARVRPEWRIEIEKKIPVAAGLGGGSSDAAAVLRLLNRIHGRPLRASQLAALALEVGADVPFFLTPRPALARGLGEKLEPLPAPPRLAVAVAAVRFPVRAAWAYAAWDRLPRRPAASRTCEEFAALLRPGTAVQEIADNSFNALEFAILEKFPIVGLVREFLLAHGALCARVSGSGPSVFSVWESRPRAGELGAALRREFGPRADLFVSG